MHLFSDVMVNFLFLLSSLYFLAQQETRSMNKTPSKVAKGAPATVPALCEGGHLQPALLMPKPTPDCPGVSQGFSGGRSLQKGWVKSLLVTTKEAFSVSWTGFAMCGIKEGNFPLVHI